MSDLYGHAALALKQGALAALPLTFLLGVVSSLGPCNGPRVLALSGLILRARNPIRVGVAFIGGQLAMYLLFGIAGLSLMSQLTASAGWLYSAIAVAGVGGGAFLLLAARWSEGCTEPHRPSRDMGGAAFAAGAAFALLIQPCCTPIMVAIVALTATAPLLTFALLAAFGVGHAAPVFLVGFLGEGVLRKLQRSRLQQATEIVAAASLVGVGAYYALLV